MFLDELIQKGWGLGSGISIFIMGGVAQQILWSLFSPLPGGDGASIGVVPMVIQALQADISTGMIGFNLAETFFRSNSLPSIFGLCLTAGVLSVSYTHLTLPTILRV